MQQAICKIGHSSDRGSSTRLPRVDRCHARSRGLHQWGDPLRRDLPSADERRNTVRQSRRARGARAGNQSRYWGEAPGRSLGRKNHRGSRRPARTPRGVRSNGRPFCQVARGDCPGRWCSEPGVHRGQRAGAGSLCGAVPGGRHGPRRRAGSAHGRRAYPGSLQRGHRGSPADRLRSDVRARRDARGHDS